MLKENLKNVEQTIQAACEKGARKRADVTLVAVSKTKPVEMLQEIYDAGVRDFGENKVQEICEKYDNLQTKFGVSKADTLLLAEEVAHLDSLHVEGLMAVAPYVEDPEKNRKYFREIRQLAVDIRRKNIDNIDMHVLSIGMTGDYAVAIEEGATIVRVGTGIFGEREYHNK